jgi:hypothetical protein
MYANGNIISVETIPGMGEEGIKDRDGGSEFNYDILDIYCKNFCKCHMYSQHNNKKDLIEGKCVNRNRESDW